MKLLQGCAAVFAVMSVGACADEKPAVSLAGKWDGVITCYSMESPLQMTIDAAKPQDAVMGMGDGGVFAWDAAVTIDSSARAVTIKSKVPSGDAQVLTGTLGADGKEIIGNMDKQLCSKFKLTRQS
jgi:hypothetical protein